MIMNTVRVKYPRTMHLPWSPGLSDDDRLLSAHGLNIIASVDTVLTEKMDGGNVTLMRDAFYCRSLDSGTPAWEKYAKSLWARIAHDIPEGWRVSCESMWARRSIAYDNLDGALLVFGVWTGTHLMSWDDTVEWSALLGLPTVPVLGRNIPLNDLYRTWTRQRDERTSEGFVVRDACAFPIDEFPLRVAKWVRYGHVQTEAGWRYRTDYATNGFKQLNEVSIPEAVPATTETAVS